MSLINISNLSFTYDGSYDPIFENVSFSIDTDWKLGFIGRNGRGKTTFLKLVQGEMACEGSITAAVSFDYFPPHIDDAAALTIDVVTSFCANMELWRLIKELSLLDVSDDVLYRPFETLSHGERTKVLLASMFLKENNFLLIDEPTNHLDLGARQVVQQYLASKKGFILVSHDRAFLDACIDHVLSINKQNIEAVKGNFSSWWQNKENQDNREREQDRVLKEDIERLTIAAQRASSWSDKLEKTKYGTRNSGLRPDRGHIGAKSAKMMKRAKVTETRALCAAEEKAGLLKNVEMQETLKLHPLRHHKEQLVQLKDVSIAYGEAVVCSGINFDVLRGDRIALCGRNGSGKSSILKLVFGEEIAHSGAVALASGLKISYVSQDTSALHGGLHDYALALGIDETQFKTILRKMGFSRIQFEKNIEEFSSGQKKKTMLAGSLCEQAHLYIWDEPLNFIDVLSRIQIEALILQYAPSMLFVEHDAAFCENVSTKMVHL